MDFLIESYEADTVFPNFIDKAIEPQRSYTTLPKSGNTKFGLQS